jgi:hypothetical protein
MRETIFAVVAGLLERGWKIVPTSCTCGGSWAWVKPVQVGDDPNGAEEMHGCVCHCTPIEELVPMHSATAALVGQFAFSLALKLALAEVKYGFENHWLSDGWKHGLAIELTKHVEKGDPRDVAAFCAFAWHHGWSTRPEISPEMLNWFKQLITDFPWGDYNPETREAALDLAGQLTGCVQRSPRRLPCEVCGVMVVIGEQHACGGGE